MESRSGRVPECSCTFPSPSGPIDKTTAPAGLPLASFCPFANVASFLTRRRRLRFITSGERNMFRRAPAVRIVRASGG